MTKEYRDLSGLIVIKLKIFRKFMPLYSCEKQK